MAAFGQSRAVKLIIVRRKQDCQTKGFRPVTQGSGVRQKVLG